MNNGADSGATPLRRLVRRRVLFTLVGVAQGVVFYLLGEFGDVWFRTLPAPSAGAAALFTAAAPLLLYLAYTARRQAESIAFAIGMALLLALFHFWFDSRAGLQQSWGSDVLWASAICAVIIGYVALPFFQVWQEQRRTQFPYSSLIAHYWDNGLILLAASVFLLSLWLLLLLWASLFRLVDIDFVGRLFEQAWFAKPVTGLTIGLGVALLREQERIVRSLRSLVFALMRALAPVLPVAAVLFLAMLPFAGLEPLWRTGHATTILLVVIGVGIVLANAVVGDGNEPVSRAIVLPVMVQLALMPILIGLAFYGTGLRIIQHGLTPGRVYAVVLIFAFGLYAVIYSYAVLRHRTDWGKPLSLYNPLLAIAAAVLALLIQSPLIDPYWISSINQYDRLAGGDADPATFDYGYLKHKMGAPGRRALARIRKDSGVADRAEVDRQLAALDSTQSYSAWKEAQRQSRQTLSVESYGPLADYVLVRPVGAALPKGLAEYLRRQQTSLLSWCHRAPHDRCAVIVADLSGDEIPEGVIVRKWYGSSLEFQAFRLRDGRWQSYDRWNSSRQKVAGIWDRLTEGDMEVVPPAHRELKFGDVTVPLAPRR